MAERELIEDVLGAWLDSRERGEAADPAALLRAHPDLAGELPRHLRALDLLDRVFGPKGSPGYGVPSRLGPHRIEEQIGAGGMGTVFRALVEEPWGGLTAGTTVAAKVVHPHVLRTKGFFPRFHREAALGRTVEHPNVVRTFGFDVEVVDDVPLCYLVMEYVEGQTLRALLDELGSVGEPLARAVGQQVALGLSAIHAAGAVHRDVKPENVLITRQNMVKVMDLGVARLDGATASLSRTGAFVGSLAYAAPEQFDGSELDPRCDLHALGVLLYELCTGENPFGADSAVQVMQRIRSLLPRRLSDAAPHVSELLDDVVHTLLAKSRDDRLSSAAEVAELLDAGEDSEWWRRRSQRRCGARARPSRRARVPRETAVHGRDDVLAALRSSFDRTTRGEGSVVLVEGEAGIGKSRVVDELCRALDETGADFHLLLADALPGTGGDEALRAALHEHLGSTGSASLLTELPLLVPAFDALLEGREPPEGAVPLTRDSLATCFVHALRGMAAQWPTILVVEDLHNASDEARALFTNLAYAVPGHRVLLVGTSRPGVPEEWRANLLRLEHVTSMPLARLGPRDLAQLLEESFRSQLLAERLAYLIGTKSDGNPFFVLEIVRGLREAGLVVRRDDGSWESTQEIDEVEVPDTVRELIEARLSSLSDDERHVLDVAACCGFEFDPSLVADAMDAERIPLIRTLAQIERRHRLVRASGRQFTFDHHQVLEVLHQSLPEPLREAYHLAIAEALERRQDTAEQDPEALDGALCVELCEHFLEGREGESALRYLDAALAFLERSCSHARSVALTQRALEAPGLLRGIERARSLLRLAGPRGPLDMLGRRSCQEAHALDAQSLLQADSHEGLLGKAAAALGAVYLHTARFEESEAAFRRAMGHFRSVEDRQGEARTAVNLGTTAAALSRPTEARQHIERGLALSLEIGDRTGEATALARLGALLFDAGHLAESEGHSRRGLALFCDDDDRIGQVAAAGTLGNALHRQGRFPEARRYMGMSLELAGRIGHRLNEAIMTSNLASLCWDEGNAAQAKELTVRSLALSQELGRRSGEAIACGHLGNLLRTEGHLAEAREHHERSLALSREIGDRPTEAFATGNLGVVLYNLGRPAEAEKCFERQLALTRAFGERLSEGVALMRLGLLAWAEDDTERARRLIQESLELWRAIRHGPGVASSLIALGDLERQAGDLEAARAALEEGTTSSREQGLHTVTALGQALLACLPGGDTLPALEALKKLDDDDVSPMLRVTLWMATGDREHLVEAKRLLDDLLAKNPPEHHESMCRNVRVNREILAAWVEEFGESPETAAPSTP